MNPFVAGDLARLKMADMQAEADRAHLANVARAGRAARKAQSARTDSTAEPRWSLRRMFARVRLSGSGA
jgi:hypothetical protein